MENERRRKEGFFGFLTYLFENSRYWVIGLIGVIFFGVWGFVHYNAEPGQQVVVWGLFQYTKRASQRSSGNNDWQVTPVSRQVESPTATLSPTSTPQQTPTASPTPVSHSTTPPIPHPTATPIPRPKYDIAIFIVNTDYRVNAELSSHIRSIMKQYGKSSIILPSDIMRSSQIFNQLFQGNGGEARRIGLLSYGKYTLFGKIQTSFVQQGTQFENMITADVALDIRIIASNGGNIEESMTISQKGPGFSQHEAEQAALERIRQELSRQLPRLVQYL